MDSLFDSIDFGEQMPEPVQQSTFESAKSNWAKAVESYYLALRNDPNVDLTQADTRFSTSLPLYLVQNTTVAIVGAGGLGNWQWRVLLSMGFNHVVIFDDDTVSIENIGPQAHSLLDLGVPKVEAVQRAAMEYRGTQITAINERVSAYGDICRLAGYSPDIVITCTDSAEFRNGFIKNLSYNIRHHNQESVPVLLLDYRMSMGDWVCYAIPARSMASVHGLYTEIANLLVTYEKDAVFKPEEAVQEPCTARAISYTGMHAASYTGAFLHWWLTGGNRNFPILRNGGSIDSDSNFWAFFQSNTNMSWKVAYSAKDWEAITYTPRERRMMNSITNLKGDRTYYIETITNLAGIAANRTLKPELIDVTSDNFIELCELGAYLIPKVTNSNSLRGSKVCITGDYVNPATYELNREWLPQLASVRLTRFSHLEATRGLSIPESGAIIAYAPPVIEKPYIPKKPALYYVRGMHNMIYQYWAALPSDTTAFDRFLGADIYSLCDTNDRIRWFGAVGKTYNDSDWVHIKVRLDAYQNGIILDPGIFYPIDHVLDWWKIKDILPASKYLELYPEDAPNIPEPDLSSLDITTYGVRITVSDLYAGMDIMVKYLDEEIAKYKVMSVSDNYITLVANGGGRVVLPPAELEGKVYACHTMEL